jgi:hypothetical protein
MRTTALPATLLFTEARVSGLLGADIEDLGTDRGHRVMRVRRKGGKIQALALPAQAAGRIDAYLACWDDVTALPATIGNTSAPRRRVLFATGHRGADVPGRGPRPSCGLGQSHAPTFPMIIRSALFLAASAWHPVEGSP